MGFFDFLRKKKEEKIEEKEEGVVKKTASKKAATRKSTTEKVGGTFAVIETGGKQYKVSKGSLVSIEKIKPARPSGRSGEAKGIEYKKGDKISFDKVLLVDNGKDTTIGTPYIIGAKVNAEIIEIGRARKILVLRYKQKSRYLRRSGHRQPFFKVKIISIT